MLQTPIHVYPNDGEVEHVDEKHVKTNFTFQGDFLSAAHGEVVDEDNSDARYYYVFNDRGRFMQIYNGQKVSYVDANVSGTNIGWLANSLLPGANYKHKMRLFQCYPPNMPNARKPQPDIYYARGKIMATPEGVTPTASQTVIAPNLSNIRTPFFNGFTDSEDVSHVVLFGALFMEINHDMHMITGYDSSTGLVSFGKVTYNEYVDEDGYTILEVVTNGGEPVITPDTNLINKFKVVGTPYRIFANYIETGWYDFKWRTEPTSATTIIDNVNNNNYYYDYVTQSNQREGYKVFNGIELESTYTQPESVGLKWFKYKIYQIDNDIEFFVARQTYNKGDYALYVTQDLHGNRNDKLYRCKVDDYNEELLDPDYWELIDVENNTILLEDMDKQFTYELRHTMPINPFTTNYIACLQITTQDNDITTLYTASGGLATPTTDADGHTPAFANFKINGKSATINDNTFSCDINDSILKLTWRNDGFIYNIYRREIYDDGSLAETSTYIGFNNSGEDKYIYDCSAANNHKYRYEIIAKSSIATEYGKPIAMCYIDNVHIKWDGWKIYNLIPTEDFNNNNRRAMVVGEEWSFISDINSGDIARNINSALHVGTGSYAQTTRIYNKYESGSFTANLLTVRCPDGEIVDDIQRVKAWMDFISGDNAFLLKSDKGDVWVVDIVNSPSRQYDESFDPIFTHITYEWAESADVDKCAFFKE